MTKVSGSANRAVAASTADKLLAQRAVQFREREKELRRLITDYHHAAAQARKIQENAQAQAAKIATDAETRITALHERADKEASAFQDEANAAVQAMLLFGEPRAAVASLTQLTANQVRAIERAEHIVSAPRQDTARQPDDLDTPSAEAAR